MLDVILKKPISDGYVPQLQIKRDSTHLRVTPDTFKIAMLGNIVQLLHEASAYTKLAFRGDDRHATHFPAQLNINTTSTNRLLAIEGQHVNTGRVPIVHFEFFRHALFNDKNGEADLAYTSDVGGKIGFSYIYH